MKFFLNTFSKLSLAMLAVVSMVFFVTPTQQEAHAQSGRVTSVCFTPSSKAFILPSTGGECPLGSETAQTTQGSGFCVFAVNGQNVAKSLAANPKWSLDRDGKKCETLNSNKTPPIIEPFADYKPLASITQRYNSGGTPTTPTTPTTPGTNTPPPVQGNCDPGFHKSGPLCIPNSDVGSGKSFLKVNSVGELAAMIVKILLYFAGIVAVIMAIVGGYQIMTAAGNEAQATNGRKTLTNAIIGLVLIILSYVIISAVINFVTT